MKAKLVKSIETQNAHLYAVNFPVTVGNVYEFRNNDIDDETPIVTRTDNNLNWQMSIEFFREHFEPVFSVSASDMIFNHDEAGIESDFASLAVLLNGIINENGGFAFYCAADVEREFESRL